MSTLTFNLPDSVTKNIEELATRRNEFVAAIADEVWFAHITPGGQAEHLTHRLTEWRVPFSASALKSPFGCGPTALCLGGAENQRR
jgi:hypothetical protein